MKKLNDPVVKRLITFVVISIILIYFYTTYIILPLENSMEQQLYEFQTNTTYAEQVANQTNQFINEINQALKSPLVFLIIFEFNFTLLLIVLSQRKS